MSDNTLPDIPSGLPWSYDRQWETIHDSAGQVIGRMEPAAGPYCVAMANKHCMSRAIAELGRLYDEARAGNAESAAEVIYRVFMEGENGQP